MLSAPSRNSSLKANGKFVNLISSRKRKTTDAAKSLHHISLAITTFFALNLPSPALRAKVVHVDIVKEISFGRGSAVYDDVGLEMGQRVMHARRRQETFAVEPIESSRLRETIRRVQRVLVIVSCGGD